MTTNSIKSVVVVDNSPSLNTAIDAGVKVLYLYHHDPNYDDRAMEKIAEHANSIIEERSSSLRCYIAKEGMKIDLS